MLKYEVKYYEKENDPEEYFTKRILVERENEEENHSKENAENENVEKKTEQSKSKIQYDNNDQNNSNSISVVSPSRTYNSELQVIHSNNITDQSDSQDNANNIQANNPFNHPINDLSDISSSKTDRKLIQPIPIGAGNKTLKKQLEKSIIRSTKKRVTRGETPRILNEMSFENEKKDEDEVVEIVEIKEEEENNNNNISISISDYYEEEKHHENTNDFTTKTNNTNFTALSFKSQNSGNTLNSHYSQNSQDSDNELNEKVKVIKKKTESRFSPPIRKSRSNLGIRTTLRQDELNLSSDFPLNLILVSDPNDNIQIVNSQESDISDEQHFETIKSESHHYELAEANIKFVNKDIQLDPRQEILEKFDKEEVVKNIKRALYRKASSKIEDKLEEEEEIFNELGEKFIEFPVKDYEDLTLLERLIYDKRPFKIYLSDNILSEHIVMNLFYLNSLFVPRYLLS